MELTLFTHTAMNSTYGESFIVYNPDFQTLKIHSSYTRQKDGTIVKTPDNAFVEVLPRFAADAPAYNQLKEMVVVHTGLELGATIYLDYSIITKPGYYPALDINERLQETSPVKECKVSISVPENSPLAWQLLGSDAKASQATRNGAKEVEHLTGLYNNLRDVSFTARRGEIVGLAGLDGSGRTETLETMFGVATRKSGRILLDGKECKNLNPRQSIKNNFALLTEERRATGIFGILDIRENSVISSLDRHKRAGFVLSDKSMKKDTQWSIDAMHTKTPSQETKIRSLSGGNQQKVIIGRWLLTEPDVLLLDEPTRGIDVGAKYEIYQLILDLANKGKTVIMVSSEMPELLGVCDRILVMSGGRLAGEVDAKTATQEDIMRLAAKYV